MALDDKKILERLLEVTRNLGTMVDLETYLQALLSAAIELTESQTAALLDYEETSQSFLFKYVPWFQRDTLLNVKLPLKGSVAGRVFSHVQPLVIDDLAKDATYRLEDVAPASFAVRSIAAVPLVLQGKSVGVLEVFNKSKSYAPREIQVLQTLASLAVSAIQSDNMEKKLEASRKGARELDRLKSDFIAITSHELRTPLGVILGHSTFLRELVKGEHKEQVDTIIRSASKLKEIIESLSSMDNQQTGGATLRERQVSMARIIEDVTASFRDMAEQKGVLLEIDKDPNNDLGFDGDGNKISVALSNLIKNALSFTNKGGNVFVCGEVEGSFIKVSVIDDGMGIPLKDQPYIFDRFYQVESHLTRRHGGMGLGLSVTKAMVEMHNGQIWVESKEGVGSKFTFIIPVQGPRAGEKGEASPYKK